MRFARWGMGVLLGVVLLVANAAAQVTTADIIGRMSDSTGAVLVIAATSFDRKFRPFDEQTGALLRQTTLPYAGNGTPATYEVNGRQFVVVPTGDGQSRPLPAHADQPVTSDSGGVDVADALPMRKS